MEFDSTVNQNLDDGCQSFAGDIDCTVLPMVDDVDRRKEDRRKVDHALQKSEERYRAFVEHSSEAVWCVDVDPPCSINLSVDAQIEHLTAANGIEALRSCAEHVGHIELLITDVVMPQMGGRQLAERVAIARPETRVLYMSGYTDDAIVRHGILDDHVSFIQKPFSPDSLALKVREVLSQPASPHA